MWKIIGLLRLIAIIAHMALAAVLFPIFRSITLIICDSVNADRVIKSARKTVFRVAAGIAGLNIEVEGLEHSYAFEKESTHRLILSNHLSYMDVIAIGSIFPTGFLAKHSVLNWPIIGGAAKALGTLFVNRECALNKATLLRKISRRLKSESLCLFPEGTTTSKLCPNSSLWKAGNLWSARQSNSKVTLVGIHYAQQALSAWVDDMPLLPHLYQVLSQPKTHIYLVVSESNVLSASKCLRQAAQNVHQEVSVLCEAAFLRATDEEKFFGYFSKLVRESA